MPNKVSFQVLSKIKDNYFKEEKGFFKNLWGLFTDLLKKPLLKSASIVAAGSIISQVINIVFSPITTRFYSPDMFGTLGLINSVTNVLTPLAMLGYAYAVILPKRDADSKILVRFSVSVGFIFSFFIFLLIFLFDKPIAQVLNIEDFRQFLYFIPLLLVVTIISVSYENWLVRKKLFTASSVISGSQSLLQNLSLIGVGFFYPSHFTLVGLSVVGKTYHALAALFVTRKTIRKSDETETQPEESKKRIRDVLYEYRDFPLYRTPQIVINILSSNLPVLMLTILSGTNATGLYDLARRVLNLPVLIIAESIGKVFEQKVAETAQSGKSIQSLTIKSVLLLAVVGIVPFTVLFVFGPPLFKIVFGSEWYGAGQFAQWMSLWLFTIFISRPCIKAIPPLDLQKQYLGYEIVSMTVRIISLVAGFFLAKDDITAIAAFSIAGALSNMFLIVFVISKSKNRNRFSSQREVISEDIDEEAGND